MKLLRRLRLLNSTYIYYGTIKNKVKETSRISIVQRFTSHHKTERKAKEGATFWSSKGKEGKKVKNMKEYLSTILNGIITSPFIIDEVNDRDKIMLSIHNLTKEDHYNHIEGANSPAPNPVTNQTTSGTSGHGYLYFLMPSFAGTFTSLS